MTDERRKLRFLVLVDEDRAQYVEQVFAGCKWARVVELGIEGYPTPAGRRLVSDAAWEVLRRGSKIPLRLLQENLELFGTRYLSEELRNESELWCLAELSRRGKEQEDFDD